MSMEQGYLCCGKSNKNPRRCEMSDVCPSCAILYPDFEEDVYFCGMPGGDCIRDNALTRADIEKLIQILEKRKGCTEYIISMNKDTLKEVNLDELPSNVYVVEFDFLETGIIFILGADLKESIWERIQQGKIKYKKGKKNGEPDEI